MPGAQHGTADHVVPVEVMAGLLVDHQHHLGAVAEYKDGNGARKDMGQHLTAITGLLRAGTGHDFSGYKESTLTGRIQRRMQLLHIDDVPSYIERLKTDRGELQGLFRNAPHRRDPVLPRSRCVRSPQKHRACALDLLQGSRRANPHLGARLCNRGGVYSIAILLSECMTDSHRAQSSDIKIFAPISMMAQSRSPEMAATGNP